MESKRSKQNVFTDNEDKENKLSLQDHKAVESLKEAALETFTYNETTTATTQPLSWDAQVNKGNTLLKDITNEMCMEHSNYVEEKSELKEECMTNITNKVIITRNNDKNIWDKADFISDNEVERLLGINNYTNTDTILIK
ncbi:17527_t:CDS:1, partial [Gigaspora rosea]